MQGSHLKNQNYHCKHDRVAQHDLVLERGTNTHYRSWKSGKKWLYASSAAVLILTSFSPLSNLPFISSVFAPTKAHALTATNGTWNQVTWSISSTGALTLGATGATQKMGTAGTGTTTMNLGHPSYDKVYTSGDTYTQTVSNNNIAVLLGNQFLPSDVTSVTILGTITPSSTSSLNSLFSWLTNCTSITGLSNIHLASPGGYDASNMFSNDLSLGFSGYNTTSVPNGTLTSATFNNAAFNDLTTFGSTYGSYITNMSYMFGGDGTLFNNQLNLSTWNVSNVTNMTGMFSSMTVTYSNSETVSGSTSNVPKTTGANNITLTGWNTSSVTSMFSMFNGSNSLAVLNGIGGLDVSHVTNFASMFAGGGGPANISIGNWNTSSATSFNGMFSGSNGLKSLDLGGSSSDNGLGWNFPVSADTSNMFSTSPNLWNLSIGTGFIAKTLNGTGLDSNGSLTTPPGGNSGVGALAGIGYNGWRLVGSGGAATPTGTLMGQNGMTINGSNQASQSFMNATSGTTPALVAGQYVWNPAFDFRFSQGTILGTNNSGLTNAQIINFSSDSGNAASIGYMNGDSGTSTSGKWLTMPTIPSNPTHYAWSFTWYNPAVSATVTYVNQYDASGNVTSSAYQQLQAAMTTFQYGMAGQNTAASSPGFVSVKLNTVTSNANFNITYPSGQNGSTISETGEIGKAPATPTLPTPPTGYTLASVTGPDGKSYPTVLSAIQSNSYSTVPNSTINFTINYQKNYQTPVISPITTYKGDTNFSFPAYTDVNGVSQPLQYNLSTALDAHTTHTGNTYTREIDNIQDTTSTNYTSYDTIQTATLNANGSWTYNFSYKDIDGTNQTGSAVSVTSTTVTPSVSAPASPATVTLGSTGTFTNTITIPTATVGTDAIGSAQVVNGSLTGPTGMSSTLSSQITLFNNGTVNFPVTAQAGIYSFKVNYIDSYGNVCTATDTVDVQGMSLNEGTDSFNFGTQSIASQDKTYTGTAVVGGVSQSNGILALADTRSASTGWSVGVKQSKFTDGSGDTLNGSYITFANLTTNGAATPNGGNGSSVSLLPGATTYKMLYTSNTGTSSSSTGDIVLNLGTPELTVLGSDSKIANKTYTATLTFELDDAPNLG